MAQVSLRLLTAALLLQIAFATSGTLTADGPQGDSDTGNATPLLQRTDNVINRRHLLAPQLPSGLPNVSSLPNITIPPSLQNVTAAQAFNYSGVNQTLIIAQLTVPANLTAQLGQNETRAYVTKLVNQTLPLILACSSNATSQLYVCFKTWEAVFNRSYPNATEEQYRFTVFVNNTRAIVAQDAALVAFFTTANGTINQTQIAQIFLNEELPPQLTTLLNLTTLLSFSQYSDRTLGELGRRYSGLLPDDLPGEPTGNATLGNGTVGARRMLLAGGSGPKGRSSWVSYANPIRNQRQCGYCWVFSVTGSLEIVNNIVANGVKYAFSEEEIVDCLGAECEKGGRAEWSSWVPKNKAWASQSQDPYSEEDGSKSQCPTGAPGSWFTNLVKCNYNWNEWKKVLDVQPTLFYVYAGDNFQNYNGNTIIAWQCQAQGTNHVMVAVGYDTYTSSGGDVYEYIIFRNSWGDEWGLNGYGKWAMTKNGKDLNSCGTTSRGIVLHTNPGRPLPSLSVSCQNLALTDKIQQS